jgi:hypothetical protein
LELSPPIFLLRPLSASVDGEIMEQGRIVKTSIEGRLIVTDERDQLTEQAIFQLLEVQEQVFDVLDLLTGADGIEINHRASSMVDAAQIGKTWIAARAYRFDMLTTTDKYFHPPTRLAATDQGGGTARLTWKAAPTRFDTLGGDTPKYTLRRASGSTPPASETSGTGVSVTDGVVTHDDTPGSGTWSYSLFAQYDETGTGTAEKYSPADTRAQVTITLA